MFGNFTHQATGILEEVAGFATCTKKGLFALTPPVDLFVEQLRQIKDTAGNDYYSGIEVLELDAGAWIDVARPRTPAVVATQSCNGSRVALLIGRLIEFFLLCWGFLFFCRPHEVEETRS